MINEMNKMEELMTISLEKIAEVDIKEFCTELIEDYKLHEDKEIFLAENKEEILDTHQLVKQLFPDAFETKERTPKKQKKEEAKKEIIPLLEVDQQVTYPTEKSLEGEIGTILEVKYNDKGDISYRVSFFNGNTVYENIPQDDLRPFEKKEANKKKAKQTVARLDEYEENIQECRRVIKEYNAKKRKNQPQKKKLTRSEKLTQKAIALAKLTPPDLAGDSNVIETNRTIIDQLILSLMENWQMTDVKKARKAADEELDEIELKAVEKVASNWAKEITSVKAYAKRWFSEPFDELEEELQKDAHQKFKHLNLAIESYGKNNKKNAFKILDKHFLEGALKLVLPEQIFEEYQSYKN
ncbi:MAG: hypothetical protein WBA74_01700 [Cyclobacteriaceae bacterium]